MLGQYCYTLLISANNGLWSVSMCNSLENVMVKLYKAISMPRATHLILLYCHFAHNGFLLPNTNVHRVTLSDTHHASTHFFSYMQNSRSRTDIFLAYPINVGIFCSITTLPYTDASFSGGYSLSSHW